MRKQKTKAEKVANEIAELVNDITLDLDKVGYYIAEQPNITYNRVILMAEAAVEEKEKENVDVRYQSNSIFQ